ncbi:MAG: YgiQ family radical SAM protein [Ignavibacteriales bacterium]|nr:YgiQ family radical SAM protein [Ignavibacteriales bacterium]
MFPTSVKEMKALGWDRADVILFSGDAFVDHPAFGAAVIARVLEHAGFRVAVVPQPNWRDDLRDFKKLEPPALFFGVTAGNMDSMVNHYTANKRLRSNDAYTPGNLAGQRPDYAVTVYSKILKSLHPETPLILGGIEASLRRLTHYDYWSDSLKPSILIDTDADLLVYGNGELAIVEIAKRMHMGEAISSITDIPQTGYRTNQPAKETTDAMVLLGSYEECLRDKKVFARNFAFTETETNKLEQRRIAEQSGQSWIVINPPYPPATHEQLDAVYDLPYTRRPHPRYQGKGPITAFEMIKDSVTIHRGCFGGCSFCTIAAHQGKFISSRSQESVLSELHRIADDPDFKGHITDLGGPSANMYEMEGVDLEQCASCERASCIFPAVCPNLDASHAPLMELYEKARQIRGIKKITIGSGIRYDLIIDRHNKPVDESSLPYLEQLVVNHVSGRLKVAPEHTSDKVLKLLRKPSFKMFKNLRDRFNEICERHGLRQQLIPYFISSLPASELDDMAELSDQLRELGMNLEQVQDFTPTPMTLASVEYYTGLDPYSMKELFIPRSPKEKKTQQLFFFLYKKEKREELKKALSESHRQDIARRLGL